MIRNSVPEGQPGNRPVFQHRAGTPLHRTRRCNAIIIRAILEGIDGKA
ncbi:MAG: hypothetical protein WGN25_06120 [Candidatus Electrothrix sp. GW3-4]